MSEPKSSQPSPFFQCRGGRRRCPELLPRTIRLFHRARLRRFSWVSLRQRVHRLQVSLGNPSFRRRFCCILLSFRRSLLFLLFGDTFHPLGRGCRFCLFQLLFGIGQLILEVLNLVSVRCREVHQRCTHGGFQLDSQCIIGHVVPFLPLQHGVGMDVRATFRAETFVGGLHDRHGLKRLARGNYGALRDFEEVQGGRTADVHSFNESFILLGKRTGRFEVRKFRARCGEFNRSISSIAFP